MEVDFFALILYFVGNIATETLMGRRSLKMSHNFLQDIFEFDASPNTILSGLPNITAEIIRAKGILRRLALLSKNGLML